MKPLARTTIAILIMKTAIVASAQMTPIGIWNSVDEKTKKVTAEIRVSEVDGVLIGRIQRDLDPKAKPGDLCTTCKDDRKGQPTIGLEIIRGAQKSEGKDVWEGGTIMDPEDGTVYKLKMTPIDDGKKLQVRGFVGFSLLGRTQTWQRVQQ